jgi:hypothetical protein
VLHPMRRVHFRALTPLQQAMAPRPSLRVLCEARANQGRRSRPQELGVRHPWQGEDYLGGRPFQAHDGLSRRYVSFPNGSRDNHLLPLDADDKLCRVSYEATKV